MDLNLFFPRPSTVHKPSPEAPSTAPSSRQPPPNFVAIQDRNAKSRALARILREPKSPFLVKNKSQLPRGKERDLSECTTHDLVEMSRRNESLLINPAIIASLPGGSARIDLQQTRINSRLQELHDLNQIRNDLDKTHLVDDDSDGDELSMETQKINLGRGIKEEEVDVKMEPESEAASRAPATPTSKGDARSPRTKRRILDRIESKSPHSLTSTMSLAESITLQRKAVERDRISAAKRLAQLEMEAKRNARTRGFGGDSKASLLKSAAELEGFVYQDLGSEEEEELDDDLDFGISGQMDDEEEAGLNPYRAAYESGYARANEEDDRARLRGAGINLSLGLGEG